MLEEEGEEEEEGDFVVVEASSLLLEEDGIGIGTQVGGAGGGTLGVEGGVGLGGMDTFMGRDEE